MITFSHKGNFSKTERFLSNAAHFNALRILESYGKKGVEALRLATPMDTGETRESWTYAVTSSSRGYKLTWSNSHVVDGVIIAVILQYGHGTGNGGYVSGRDYINPAIKPIFDEIATNLWEEVSKL